MSNELETRALAFLKDKEYDKAAKIYLQLALNAPENEKFLLAAASCYDRLQDKKTAMGLYKKALSVNPQCFTALINLATDYYELAKYDKTIYFAEKALALQANDFAALLNLGNAYYTLGKNEEAFAYYERLYSLNPNSYNVLLNLASTCYNLGQFPRAVELAEKAIEKRPISAEPYILAGNSLIELFRHEEAYVYLKKAAEMVPTSAWLCNFIANMFQKMGNWKQCLHYAWRAFGIKKENVSADDHINLAYLLYEALDDGQGELVERYLTRWESLYPDDPIVHHTACALRNDQKIEAMDLGYVKKLFDGFASSFDVILGDLDYQVPYLIAEKLRYNLKTKLFKKRRILDLGCGTGLCSAALKTYFPNEEYYGVDVSERMLDMAEKKHIYTALYADDIMSFLDANEQSFHAAVAGDVLTYMGNLRPLFRRLTSALKINGLFCFSISKNLENNNDYLLTPSGRFVHSLGYVQRLLKYYGLKTISVDEAVLRHEGARNVEGFVILAQKEIEVVFKG